MSTPDTKKKPRRRLKTWQLILLIAVAIGIVMATIHFSVNGIPSLEFLNPHAH